MVHALLRPVRPVDDQWQVDLAGIAVQHAFHHRLVALADLALLELHRQRRFNRLAACVQQQPGGDLVEPVHGQCVGIQRLQARDHAVLVFRQAAGHREQAGGFFRDQQGVIEVMQVDHAAMVCRI